MHASDALKRRLAASLAVGITAASSLGFAATGHAEEVDANAYNCAGHIGAGTPEPASEGKPVRYLFACDGPILGYQLESQIPLVGIESAPIVSNNKGQPLSEIFSCGGELPGYALNCVGSALTPYDEISGQFYIGTKLCAEPREDPLLTVTYAYLEKGVVTQGISGPFDLGRPRGCKADGHTGDRLEPSGKGSKKGKKGKRSKKGSKGKKG